MEKLLKYFLKYKTHDDETFAFVKYPGVNKFRYVVSNYGKIFSFTSLKEKKFYIDKDGYFKTSIIFTNPDGSTRNGNVFIHRIVAYTFIKKPEDCNIVNHLDGKKNNNYYKNLEWTTPSGNTRHALKNGLQCNSGVNCPSAIYSEILVRKICAMLENGSDVYEIYKEITGDKKVENRAIYALIFSIKSGKRHKEISSEYNIPSKVVSKTRKKFTQEEVDQMIQMLKDKKSTTEIIQFFGGHSSKDKIGKRIFDKLQIIKRTYPELSSTTIES